MFSMCVRDSLLLTFHCSGEKLKQLSENEAGLEVSLSSDSLKPLG